MVGIVSEGEIDQIRKIRDDKYALERKIAEDEKDKREFERLKKKFDANAQST